LIFFCKKKSKLNQKFQKTYPKSGNACHTPTYKEMLYKILRIRFLQIKRSLQDLSILHVIALVIILSGIGLSLAASFTSQKKGVENAWILAALTAASFLSLQLY
jgi:TRAP-type C4-dicarboxylate transport system permease small subunit